MTDPISPLSGNIFPKWANRVPGFIMWGALLFLCFIIFVFWYWFSPKNTDVGYAPRQPIPYSHKLHVGELGMDCRYCHYTIEKSGAAAIPPTEVCMNCHNVVKKDNPEIMKIRDSFATGKPIEWVKVHRLPDYVYFNHSRHVNSGISCYSCHGRIDKMEVVHQVQPLSMSWCLDCHRNPEKNLRPKEFVTQLDWKAEDQEKLGLELKKKYHINPGEDCSVCHR
ncbi:MAG: cytochrome c3 family protein [Candidatus Margulisiibacteriota bacterium]